MNNGMMEAVEMTDAKETYKECGCGTSWEGRETFLTSKDVEIVGYQVNFKALTAGLFLFNHNTCGSTLAISASDFEDLYDGPVFRERQTGKEDCPGHCLHDHELSSCPVDCECAWVRQVVQTIKNWPNNGES